MEMRYLVNNQVYDIEKSKKILEYIKPIECTTLLLGKMYPRYEHTLYRTAKGKFFVHVGKYTGSSFGFRDEDYIELLTEDEVKRILENLNKIELYEELFGELEEG